LLLFLSVPTPFRSFLVSTFPPVFAASLLATLLAGAAAPALAGVQLVFSVSNVQRNDCSGPLQPDCTLSAAASFTETLWISDTLLGGVVDNSGGGVLSTEAHYGFANPATGTPFTSALSARLSGPVTSSAAGTDLASLYDSAGGIGLASALIATDASSDVIDPAGSRTQQQYKRSYVFQALFSDPLMYADLFTTRIDEFFARYVGTSVVGGYGELGSSSEFDALSGLFRSYDFSELTGDIQLVSASRVPEPASLALVLAALLAVPLARRRRAA
jgi:hypothetical protein